MLICLLALSLILNSCSKSNNSYGNTTGTGNSNAVSIRSSAFSVATLNVSAGTEVTWTNNDAITHTVTADDGSFDSGNILSGGTYKHKFTTTGTFNYHCSIHTMMMASVVVN